MKKLVAPSILDADYANLGKDIDVINQSNGDWVHVDVMDGQFVPNISFGFPICKAVQKTATKAIDIHLMIVNPEKYVKQFARYGAQNVTIHYEAVKDLQKSIEQIVATGVKPGIAINPETDPVVLKEVIKSLFVVNVMGVNPGFGGQKLISTTIDKVVKLRAVIDEAGADTLIQIDGGVTMENAAELYAAGADVLVAGSLVYKSDNPISTINALKSV